MRRIGTGIVYGGIVGSGAAILGTLVLLGWNMMRQHLPYVGPELNLILFTTPVGSVAGAVVGALWGLRQRS